MSDFNEFSSASKSLNLFLICTLHDIVIVLERACTQYLCNEQEICVSQFVLRVLFFG